MPMTVFLFTGPCQRPCWPPWPTPATHASRQTNSRVCPDASSASLSAVVATGGSGRGRLGAASPPS
eukprot:7307966-Prorocentrum_lima.AAC.1